jgi:ribosome-associated protein
VKKAADSLLSPNPKMVRMNAGEFWVKIKRRSSRRNKIPSPATEGDRFISKRTLTSLSLAKSVVEFALNKKAEDVVVLDMRKVANFCDYFVISTGNSDRQTRAIADGIIEGLEKKGQKARRQQGLNDGRWVIVDLGDVVAHVFEREMREFYGLEYLWQEAKRIELKKK